MEPALEAKPNGASTRWHGIASYAAPLQYLYTNNPFYAISAALILVGLHVLFHDRDAAAQPNAVTFNNWLLLGVLGAYAILLVLTGCVIVRLGQVWDDTRTILLSVVFVIVAMSVSFDKLVLTHSATMSQLLLAGLLFSLALAEGVLRGLRIRLPALFRGPLYLTLGLFFLYPVLLQHLLDSVGERDPQRGMEWTLWAIFLFPSAAAAVTLTLLPAVWRGPAYVADNGTPWAWPWFPWSLFAVLGGAIGLRSYYLTVSFHPFPGTASAFGVYFLVPFLLAGCLLVFELGRSAGRADVQTFALVAPLSLLVAALPGTDHSPVYAQFLTIYMQRAGSPLLLACWGLMALYTYAWLRGARYAMTGAVGLLAFVSLVGPNTVDLRSFHFPAVEPLLLAALVLWVRAVLQPTRSLHWFLAAVGTVATLTVALWRTAFLSYAGAVPIHLLLGSVLMLGLVFRDGFARFLRYLGSLGLMGVSVAALVYDRLTGALPAELIASYLIAMLLVAWGYWYSLRGLLPLVAAGMVSGCWVCHAGLLTVSSLRRLQNPAGALLLLGGATCFLIAAGISLVKAGMWQRVRERFASTPQA